VVVLVIVQAPAGVAAIYKDICMFASFSAEALAGARWADARQVGTGRPAVG